MKSMNVTINKDISLIHDTVFWGFPLRETILGGVTVAIGILVHSALKEQLESDSAVNIITAFACIPTGFLTLFKYQGLSAEKIVVEVFRSIFMKKTTVLVPENRYSDKVKELIRKRQKEGLRNDKIAEKKHKRKKAKL